MIRKIKIHASTIKDKYSIELAHQIIKIPKEVKTDVLKKFMDMCSKINRISFLEWRLKFPGNLKVKDKNQILKLLDHAKEELRFNSDRIH